MKLYYSNGACSLAPHIALREAELPFELVRASTKTHKLDDGTDFYSINPKGYVPVLELDDGERLTEAGVILQYIADLAPAAKLAPPFGTLERYRLMEWLNFITSELHKSFAPLFYPSHEETQAAARASIARRLAWVDEQLAQPGHELLMGTHFTVADAYLFTVVNWTQWVKIDMQQWPHIAAYMDRIRERPAVQAALRAEGLLR
ncbi:MAG: glutathione transferase GstA [Aquabacterium sp.]|nr:glutathione transferase GstA [Aquabacterium sp.]